MNLGNSRKLKIVYKSRQRICTHFELCTKKKYIKIKTNLLQWQILAYRYN